jgi:Glycosyltransferases, probably involved in cell wall biogenesis
MVDALCAPPIDPELPPPPARWPIVCLQVPTYNEPPELVVETIRSLVELDYRALQIQVIDNNTTDEALSNVLATCPVGGQRRRPISVGTAETGVAQ